MNLMEIWNPVIGYEGIYVVSNCGNVRRVALHRACNKDGSIKLQMSKRGYLRAFLYKNGKCTPHLVHRLVMAAFIGVSELEVNHMNGDKSDNRLSNLEYVTRSQNELHRARILGKCVGEKHGNAKLTNEQVREIRRRGIPHKYGVYQSLAREMGVSVTVVRNIVLGKNYSTVK